MRLFAHRQLVQAARLHYTQPHRGYHNAEHLDELIVLARQHAPDLDDAEQLAILFHDAVYVPGAPRGDNERLSAKLMAATVATHERAGADLAIAPEDVARAGRIIEVTLHAEPPPAEAERVCDLDLWRLAAPWEAFEQHTLGVRHENLHLFADEAAFWKARSSFLQGMLARPFLYATPYFRERFEAAARANLTRSIARSPA
jgi:predicted metal-dependent HD superfamily phosphohydrolase